MIATEPNVDAARFDLLREETRCHRRRHGCHAYTFEDGAGLLSIARAEGAARILELGTAIGYTACILASATDRTEVETIERDPEHVALARQNLEAAGLKDRVTVLHGDFLAVMASLQKSYDLVFFDGLGPTLHMIERLRALLKPGGLLVCSNLVWAADAEQQTLEAEFNRLDRWLPSGRIEGGATRTFRKLSADAA